IDLYQIHRWDDETDHDETLGALTDLVRAGKVRYIGSSTYPPSEIVAAQWVAEKRGHARFVCEQPPYSMLVRGIETEVLPVLQQHALGAIISLTGPGAARAGAVQRRRSDGSESAGGV
ncbi:MAG: hypothetical protein QOF27_1595, partial [Gaiellaceae bacterium]|nr:hypothetical protein [Gaiellaceae bacterium]